MTAFKIKICGITRAVDAIKSIEFGADAIGLNFYKRSLRSVSVEQARAITQELDGIEVVKVGVFVNASANEILEIASQVGLDEIQLHGDEEVGLLSEIEGLPVVRAIRCGERENQHIESEINRWSDAGIQKVLVDSAVVRANRDAEYGGTGETLAWGNISKIESNLPLILAGGLNPDNVAEAIRTVHPAAVDTASGVEGFPGKKDHSVLQRFVENALEAFQKFDNS